MAATLPLPFDCDDRDTRHQGGGQAVAGGTYRTPQRRQQRYIELPECGERRGYPEPLVLFDYSSPAAMNERLEMALAQRYRPDSDGGGRPLASRSVPFLTAEVSSWAEASRGAPEAGRTPSPLTPIGEVSGRAVLVAKGSPMVYLAAHVLCNVSHRLGSGKLNRGAEGLPHISMLYDQNEQVKAVRVTEVRMPNGDTPHKQGSYRHCGEAPYEVI